MLPVAVEKQEDDFAPVEPPQDIAPAPGDISVEAYNLYLARGCQDGFDVEDWLAAEELLRSRSLNAT